MTILRGGGIQNAVYRNRNDLRSPRPTSDTVKEKFVPRAVVAPEYRAERRSFSDLVREAALKVRDTGEKQKIGIRDSNYYLDQAKALLQGSKISIKQQVVLQEAAQKVLARYGFKDLRAYCAFGSSGILGLYVAPKKTS